MLHAEGVDGQWGIQSCVVQLVDCEVVGLGGAHRSEDHCGLSGIVSLQIFAVVGIVLFIASAKMAIDPTSARVSTRQMKDMQNIIKHQIRSQIKTSMKSNIKLQKKDVKTRESDTHEVHSLENQVGNRVFVQCVPCAGANAVSGGWWAYPPLEARS